MNKKMMGLLAGLALIVGLVSSGLAMATPMISTTSNTSSVLGNISGNLQTYYNVGFQFQVNQTLEVTHLGIFDFLDDGLQNTHEVGLWMDDGTLLASASFNAGDGTLIDRFRYLSIASMELIAGDIYRIAATYINNDLLDRLNVDVLPLDEHVFDPAITRLTGAGLSSETDPSLAFPTILGDPNFEFPPQPSSILGPNFQATVTVPEPSPLVLLGIGLAGMGFARKRIKM